MSAVALPPWRYWHGWLPHSRPRILRSLLWHATALPLDQENAPRRYNLKLVPKKDGWRLKLLDTHALKERSLTMLAASVFLCLSMNAWAGNTVGHQRPCQIINVTSMKRALYLVFEKDLNVKLLFWYKLQLSDIPSIWDFNHRIQRRLNLTLHCCSGQPIPLRAVACTSAPKRMSSDRTSGSYRLGLEQMCGQPMWKHGSMKHTRILDDIGWSLDILVAGLWPNSEWGILGVLRHTHSFFTVLRHPVYIVHRWMDG